MLLLVPHLVAFNSDQVIDHFAVCGLVALLLLIELLECAYFIASGLFFFLFDPGDGSFTVQGNGKHVLIAIELGRLRSLLELTFGFVVMDQFLSLLSVELEYLIGHVLLSRFLLYPPLLKHVLLIVQVVSFFLSLHLASVLLPIEYSHCF